MPNILNTFFLLALVLPALCIDTEISPLKFGDSISLEMEKNQIKFFTFTIPKLEVDKDLLILARPNEYSSDPDLFLSTKNHYPSSAVEAEYSSIAFGFGSINLPTEELKENTPYYLGVKCASHNCSLNVSLEYQTDIYMEAEREHLTLYYIKEKTQIIRAYIPEDATIEHVLFATEVQGQLDDKIYMYVNKGNDTPDTSNFNVKSFVGWKDGKAAGVFKGDENFCTGCNYTIAIEAPRDAVIVFSRKVYGPTRDLQINSAGSNDALHRNSNITYKVDLTTLTEGGKALPHHLTVQITPYLGSLETFVNFNQLPANINESEYDVRHHSSERIDIDLTNVTTESPLETLYVTVVGKTYSNFHIKIETSDQDSILLIPGEFEFGIARPGAVSNFLASVYGNGQFDMSIDVLSNQGAVAVFVKRCQDKDKCRFETTEVSKLFDGTSPTSTKDPILLYTNVTHNHESIDFTIDGTLCGAVNDPICLFAVGVTPINETTPVNFTVAAIVKGEPRALKVNTPTRESIRMNDYSYYYFTVATDEDIEEVGFQITEISGAVFVYISREERYPDARNHEKPNKYNDLYSFDKESFQHLNGTYYVAVTSMNSATYSILPKVKYTNQTNNNTNTNDTHVLQLDQEVPQKTTLEPNEIAFFKFSVRQKEAELEGIEIFLTDVRGQFSVCVRNDGQLPQKLFCQWSTTNNTLQISPSDPNFKADATYIVSVHTTTPSTSDIANSFVIIWSKFSSFKTLSTGPSISSKVTKDSPQFYKIEVYPDEDKELVIGEQTTSVADFVELFVFGVKPDKNTNFREAAGKTKVITESQLILDESTINKLCTPPSSRNTPKFCVLYIVITTNSTSDVKFNLGLMKEPETIKVSENVETMAFFPATYSPIHLYYYPSQRKDISIIGFSVQRAINVYVNVIDTDSYVSRGKWPFPTKAKNDYASLSPVHSAVDVHIPAYALSGCGAYGKAFTCVVAITVDYEQPKANEGQGNVFFILASQEVIPITTGRPITSSVESNGFKYFSLDVSKTQATLLISVVCVSKCQNQVVVAKGEDKRPTPFGGYDYSKNIGTSEALQISDADAPGNSMKGTWIIGVFGGGTSNSSFVLEVAFEEQKILNLVSATPVEAAVPAGQTINFVFFHLQHEVLNFRITREKGVGKYWITKLDPSITMEKNIPTQSNHLWGGSLSYSQDMVKIDPSDPNFCSFCKYLVTIEAEKDMRFSIVAYAKNTAIWLRPESIIRDYVDATNKIEYRHIGTHDFLDLNVLIYSGEIELYAQLGYNVNETDYSWKRTANSATKYIRLPLTSSPDSTPKEKNPGNLETLSVLVASSKPSNYSIGISFSNSTSFLFDGRQVFGFLNPGESNNYLYYETDEAAAHPLKVQFVMYRDQFAVELNETEKFPEFKLLHLTDDLPNKTDPIEVSPYRNDIMETKDGDLFFRQMLQYAQLKPGHYKFVVINNYDNGHFNYSVAINSNAPLELPLNNMYASRTAVGKSDIYVVHTSGPGSVVVELHKCVGDVDVFVSNSLAFEEPVSTQLGNLEQSTLGSHIVFITYNMEKFGTVYIKVASINGVIDDDLFPEQEAVYKIKADFYDTEKSKLLLPYNWFSAGNEGTLLWNLKGHDIKLEFDDVNSLQSDKVSSKYGQINFTHTYDLFMTKDSMPAQYLARCDMMPKQEGIFKKVSTKSYVTYFEDKEVVSSSDNPNHKTITTPMEIEPNPAYVTLRVTLSGKNSNGDHIWSYPIIYETVQVSGNISGDAPTANIRGLVAVIIIIAILIISALYGAYYFYRRYRRVKEILNYEIQDMSSLGTVEGDDGYQQTGIELGKMKYSGLPEQSD